MMKEVYFETLPNVNIRDLSHDKNLPKPKCIQINSNGVVRPFKIATCIFEVP